MSASMTHTYIHTYEQVYLLLHENLYYDASSYPKAFKATRVRRDRSPQFVLDKDANNLGDLKRLNRVRTLVGHLDIEIHSSDE